MIDSEKRDVFISNIRNTFEEDSDCILSGLEENLCRSFRINTLKAGEEECLVTLKIAGVSPMEAGFAGAYYVCDAKEKSILSKSQPVADGKILIQNLSSMIPILALGPKSGDKVLDLCAAPGGKTSHVCAITENRAEVVAIEKSKSRFFKMKEILDNLGCTGVITIMSDATRLSRDHPEYVGYFDKILVDAPCSNESSLNPRDLSSFKYWNPKKGKGLAKLQKRLLAEAVKLLKPGGTLVYSTCTFNPEENERVVDWTQKKFPSLHLSKVDFDIPNAIPGLTKFKDKDLNPELTKTVRIIPDKYYSGFFVAILTSIKQV